MPVKGLHISEDMVKQIEQLAGSKGLTFSEMVRQLLSKGLVQSGIVSETTPVAPKGRPSKFPRFDPDKWRRGEYD